MGFFKSLIETRFFPAIGISGLTTAKRLIIQPAKEIKRAVVETAVGLSVIYPVQALKLIGRGAKAIIPTTLKGKIITATAGLIGIGILKESPIARAFAKKKVKEVPKVPERIIGFGEEVGKVIEKERTFGKEDIIKGLKTAGVVGAVTAGAIVVVPKVIEKVKEWRAPAIITVPPEKQLIPEKPVGVEGEVPMTPETTTITTGKKPYKRRRAKITPSVRQYIRVNVISRPVATGLRITNKRYINQKLLN